jgi:hypothetical protein
MSPWKKVSVGLAALGLVVLTAGVVWWSFHGTDAIWSMVDPRGAQLLADVEIPDDLPLAAWRADLAFLAEELPQRQARFERVDRRAFEAEVATLDARLPELSRPRRVLELMGIAALPGDGQGHTGISPLQRPLDWRLLPYSAWWFDDGIWITLAADDELVGAQILAVGEMSAAEIALAAGPCLSADNGVGRRHRAASVFSVAPMLEALGAADGSGAVDLTLRRPGGEIYHRRVESHPLASIGGLSWGRRLRSPVDGAWSPADPRPRATSTTLVHDPKRRLLVLRVDEVDQGIADLAARAAEILDGPEPLDRVVVDLRANGGGDNQRIEPLVSLLSGHPKADRRGVLYTLIGRRTFSAAGSLATALEHRTTTLFAGEASGFSPNQTGDVVQIPLPRSKVLVRVASRFWQGGGFWDRRPFISPSDPSLDVPLTVADHFAGHDRVIDAVLAHHPEPLATVALDPALGAALPGRYRLGPFQLLTVTPTEEGGLEMEILETGIFARSRLDPLSATRLATDLPGVFLESDPASGAVTFDGRGVTVVLERVPESFRLPVDQIRSDDPAERTAGVAAFRALAAEGHVPDSQTEFVANAAGYRLLQAGDTAGAIELFRLQTELFPQVANAWDSLADGLAAAGRTDEAIAASRRALDADPGFEPARRRLADLGAR